MKRRRLLLGLGWLALIAVAVSIAMLLAGRARISEADLDRIQAGMTPTEVEAILGPPDTIEPGRFPGRLARWQAGTAFVDVVFDEDDAVAGKSKLSESDSTSILDDSLLGRIRRWLGL